VLDISFKLNVYSTVRFRVLTPLGCLKANHRATERIDRRFDGLERCSGRRESWLLPEGGFCLVQLVKSAPRSLLVNRFVVLNVEEVNTDVREPIDALPPSTPDRKALPQRPK